MYGGDRGKGKKFNLQFMSIRSSFFWTVRDSEGRCEQL